MKHLIKYFVLLVSVVLFSGCFEILEEVTYEEGGKGSYNFTLNCSRSKNKLKGLMKLDTLMGARIPDEQQIRTYIVNAKKAIEDTKGTSEVNTSIDFENFIFAISFRFDNTTALNNALNNVAEASSRKDVDLQYWEVYEYRNNTFTRHKTPNDSLAAVAKKNTNLTPIYGATITSIYRFPTEIKSTSNKKCVIAKNKKAVMLVQPIDDVILNPKNFTNTITF